MDQIHGPLAESKMRRHLRLVVSNPMSNRHASTNSDLESRDDKFGNYADAKRQWDQSRHSGQHDERLRREAFAALKKWSPEAAAPYGDGKLWGFA